MMAQVTITDLLAGHEPITMATDLIDLPEEGLIIIPEIPRKEPPPLFLITHWNNPAGVVGDDLSNNNNNNNHSNYINYSSQSHHPLITPLTQTGVPAEMNSRLRCMRRLTRLRRWST